MRRTFFLLFLLMLIATGARAAEATGQNRQSDDSFVVSDIRVEGLQRIPASSVFAALPVNIHERVDEKTLQEAVKSLFATGNFDDIRIGRDGNVLVIQVAERPSISDIKLEGNKAIKTDALKKGLKHAGIAEGQVLKRSTLEGMRLELQRQYVAQGRYDAKIQTEVVAEPRNRVSVNITINEGNVAKIKHLNIVGNHVFSDDELRDDFELKTTGWFSWLSGNDKYSKEKLKGDLDKLESYYLNRGYINFRIDSTEVAITPDRKAVYITININEGKKYTVSNVELSGDLVLPATELKKFLLVQKGQTYSQQTVTDTEDLITNRLGNDGYLFAKVKGIPDIDEKTQKVSLKFFIDPGKRTYVRRISFRGNTRTRDQVLRREMRQMESAPAANSKIKQGRVRLDRLGFFKDVKVETPAVPGTNDEVDVNYSVTEQPSGSIGASIGYAQSVGLILGANIQQNNFLGSGKQIGFGVNVSQYQKSAKFSYVNPYYTPDGVSRGFSIYYRKTDLNKVNVASYTTDVLGASLSFGYPLSETQRLGFNLGYQRTKISVGSAAVQEIAGSPRPYPNINQYIESFAADNGTNADVVITPVPDSLYQVAPVGFLDRYGNTFNNFTITGSWAQSALNRGQLATRGYSQSIALEIAVPGSDAEYYKLTYNGQIFVPISGAWTLRFRGELGYGDGYGKLNELPFFENFFAGGFGSVRGFKTNTLGPRSTPAQIYTTLCPKIGVDSSGNPIYPGGSTTGCSSAEQLAYVVDPKTGKLETYTYNSNGSDPFGGNVLIEGGVELLFPLPFIKDQQSVRTAVFLDTGNVYDTNCGSSQQNCFNVDLGELRYSVGVGLTWITSFGPLSFSVAKPLNTGPFDKEEVFQFSLGNFF